MKALLLVAALALCFFIVPGSLLAAPCSLGVAVLGWLATGIVIWTVIGVLCPAIDDLRRRVAVLEEKLKGSQS